MDVAFEVTSMHSNNNVHKITGYWLNMGFQETYPIFINGQPAKQSFEVSVEEFKNWKLCQEPELKCIRNARWE